MSAAIEIDSLTKEYPRREGPPVLAVDDLNLSIPSGQVFGLLGRNGAGKTTTIKMLCGLVKPTAGTVRLNGHDVARQRGQAMRQLGAVLEGTRNVYWRLSPWDNLVYFGRLTGCRGTMLSRRAESLLRELELWHRRRDEVRTFSRGMQQKVAIACALIADPPIVVLDEPTLGLDVESSRLVQAWVAALAREQGKTVLLTTHQLSMAQAVCDRVAIMSMGRLVADRSPVELLGLFATDLYEIRTRGRLDGHRAAFGDFAITEHGDETIIQGEISGQKALHSLLARVNELGLPLVSVGRVGPDLEDAFVDLTGSEIRGETLEKGSP